MLIPIWLSCFLPVIGYESYMNVQFFALNTLTSGYIFILPALMLLCAVFDGRLFIRCKFNIVLGEIWLLVLYYIHCRLYVYGLEANSLSFSFYISAAAGVIIALLPFIMGHMDDMSKTNIKKRDIPWIGLFTVLFIILIVHFTNIKYDINSFYIYKDNIYKAVYR